jgi:hypothetical protein
MYTAPMTHTWLKVGAILRTVRKVDTEYRNTGANGFWEDVEGYTDGYLYGDKSLELTKQHLNSVLLPDCSIDTLHGLVCLVQGEHTQAWVPASGTPEALRNQPMNIGAVFTF